MRGLISDYASLIPPPQRDQSTRVVPWRPPPSNVVKLNVDTSFYKDTGQACLSSSKVIA